MWGVLAMADILPTYKFYAKQYISSARQELYKYSIRKDLVNKQMAAYYTNMALGNMLGGMLGGLAKESTTGNWTVVEKFKKLLDMRVYLPSDICKIINVVNPWYIPGSVERSLSISTIRSCVSKIDTAIDNIER